MNILVFTTAFFPSVGGIEKQTLALIYEFLDKGHRVKVINIQNQSITSSYNKPEEPVIDIHFQPGFFKMMQLFYWCNILYMPNFSLKGIWFLVSCPFKKWVVSHNDFYLSNNKSIRTRIKLLFIKFASQNIAVSNSVAKYINTHAKIIYNCYDNDTFKIYVDEERLHDFVFLGRLVSQKGCDLLIKACKDLKQSFTLNIIGDGPERSKLETMVQDLGLKKHIKFLGILEGEHLARALNQHRVMVIPSSGKEGFGIVALEGMACGCRIIAADAGGLSEAVNDFGKIFQMGNQKELEHLLEMELKVSDQTGKQTHSTELNNYLNAHNKEEIAGKYLFLFNQVVYQQ